MSIRTTVTLDDDVHQRIKDFGRAKGIPFREALNEVARKGLVGEPAAKPGKRFEIKPFHMGLRRDLNYDNIEELIEYLEGPLHR